MGPTRGVVIAGASCLAIGLSAGCTSHAQTVAASATAEPSGVPNKLLTHCGIRNAFVGGTWYVADKPLGHGNAPRGWGAPFQDGWIATTAAGVAVFSDGAGHVVQFHAVPSPGFLCA